MLRAGLFALRVQRVDLHAGERLAGRDEIAFNGQHVLHATGQLGGHVDLGGLDAAVAADEAVAGSCVGQQAPAGITRRGHRQGDQDGNQFSGRQAHGVDSLDLLEGGVGRGRGRRLRAAAKRGIQADPA
ncbi:hypothetical protein G6F57_016623 [Rhizopus arrhizus]|nr:hypothetical protein G6F57_016623 [Rhizopus arrhizus]